MSPRRNAADVAATHASALARALLELPKLNKAAAEAVKAEVEAKAVKAEVEAKANYDWWKANSGWFRRVEVDVSNARQAREKAQAALAEKETAIASLRRDIAPQSVSESSQPQSPQPAAPA